MGLLLLFSHIQLFATPWTGVCQAPLASTVSQSLLKFMSIESVMPFIQPSHLLLPPSLPVLNLSQHQGLFQWVSASYQVVVRLLSPVQLFATPWTAARQDSLSFTISRSLLKFMSIESVMPSNHLIFCHPLFLPSMFPCIRVFSNVLALHISWPRYWSFSFNISPSNAYSVLISFRIDWFDVLAVLKSLPQHHSSKASILHFSVFFMVQLSHPYLATEKTIALSAKWCLCFLIRCLGLL